MAKDKEYDEYCIKAGIPNRNKTVAPVQEPLEYWTVAEGWVKIDEAPVYTAPPQREWVGLTAYEVQELHIKNTHFGAFASAIEAKLKEKNT